MKQMLFTLDYELYGDGSGDVFKHIIDPTYALLNVADRYNLKFTFFFEVIEYWRLKEEWNNGNKMGYTQNPIEAIEKQIQDLYRQGHDVQLHLHPQWVNAKYQEGRWNVDLADWKLGGYLHEGEYSLVNLLIKGKQSIEELIKPINPKYRCIALRAGGYNVQPSKEIVKAMLHSGIYVDSSIYPGGKEQGTLSNYDYTNIPIDIDYWYVGEELEMQGDLGLIELPIVAFPITRWTKYVSRERIKSLLRNKESARNTFDAKICDRTKGKFSKIKFFFEKECQTWDFCLLTPSMHKKFLSMIKSQDRNLFVLVGHPKSYVGERGLKYLLKRTNNVFKYKTISDVYGLILN